MIADPPSSVEPLNEMIACPLLAVATTFVGVFATVAGTTTFDELLASPEPTLFLAITVNV